MSAAASAQQRNMEANLKLEEEGRAGLEGKKSLEMLEVTKRTVMMMQLVKCHPQWPLLRKPRSRTNLKRVMTVKMTTMMMRMTMTTKEEEKMIQLIDFPGPMKSNSGMVRK